MKTGCHVIDRSGNPEVARVKRDTWHMLIYTPQKVSPNLGLGLVVSRTEIIHFYHQSHPVCGTLLWRPSQMNTS